MPESGTVLLVDDNKGMLMTMGRILQGAGYRVLTAEDGLQATAIARAEDFGVALIDFKMNGMNGAETCAALRQINTDATLYIVTAHVDAAIKRSALVDGAAGVIHKPVDVPKLLELLSSLVRLTSPGPEPPIVGARA